METIFTPGPWQVDSSHNWATRSVSAGDKTICEFSVYGEVTEYTQEQLESIMDANAKLSAAAPDLFDLVVKLREWMENIEDGWWVGSPEKGGFDFDEIDSVLNKVSEK